MWTCSVLNIVQCSLGTELGTEHMDDSWQTIFPSKTSKYVALCLQFRLKSEVQSKHVQLFMRSMTSREQYILLIPFMKFSPNISTWNPYLIESNEKHLVFTSPLIYVQVPTFPDWQNSRSSQGFYSDFPGILLIILKVYFQGYKIKICKLRRIIEVFFNIAK